MKRTPSKSKSINWKEMTPEQIEKELGPLSVSGIVVVVFVIVV